MGLSHTVSEINGDFSRKSQFFPPPCILCPSWMGSPWNWPSALGVKELQWWGYWAENEVGRYLQPCGYNAPMWETDTGRQQRPRLRIASCGKNSRSFWRGRSQSKNIAEFLVYCAQPTGNVLLQTNGTNESVHTPKAYLLAVSTDQISRTPKGEILTPQNSLGSKNSFIHSVRCRNSWLTLACRVIINCLCRMNFSLSCFSSNCCFSSSCRFSSSTIAVSCSEYTSPTVKHTQLQLPSHALNTHHPPSSTHSYNCRLMLWIQITHRQAHTVTTAVSCSEYTPPSKIYKNNAHKDN